MTVSVVMPTYNRSAVVGSALKSVLEQTHEDFECIVIDGGSTDGTQEVIESFDDPRVRLLRRDEPAGVSAARNRGIEAADGDLIAFIDSDDWWHPEKLERQVAALRDAPPSCGVVYCAIEKDVGEPLMRDGATGDIAESMRHLDIPTYTSTLLVTREALSDCGGFDERLPCFEDWELCLRLAGSYTFTYVDSVLVAKGTGTENISAEPSRLVEAIDRLREQYTLPRDTRAQLLADAGATHCEAGSIREGRTYLGRAVRLDPTRINTVAGLAFTLSGSATVYDWGMSSVYAAEQALDGLRLRR